MVEANGSGVLLLGIGNTLMQDEGVGVHVVNGLEAKYEFRPAINIVDGGTAGMELMGQIRDATKVIIVDAVNFDEPPGTIGSIENDDILRRLKSKMSMHHLGITDVLSTIKLVGDEPEEIFLLGIQPEKIELDMEMTDTVRERIPRMEEVVLKKLGEWGIEAIEKGS